VQVVLHVKTTMLLIACTECFHQHVEDDSFSSICLVVCINTILFLICNNPHSSTQHNTDARELAPVLPGALEHVKLLKAQARICWLYATIEVATAHVTMEDKDNISMLPGTAEEKPSPTLLDGFIPKDCQKPDPCQKVLRGSHIPGSSRSGARGEGGVITTEHWDLALTALVCVAAMPLVTIRSQNRKWM